MESGLEKQINEFLEKFSQSANRAVEDEFLFDAGLTRARSKFDMEYDSALEMTGNGSKKVRFARSDLANFVVIVPQKRGESIVAKKEEFMRNFNTCEREREKCEIHDDFLYRMLIDVN
jgi:hypothetical protein